MTSMIDFSVSGSQLTGSLPTALAKLTNLQELRVHWNQLEGTVPVEYGKLSALQVVHLEGNSFRGNLESSLCGRGTPFADFVSDCANRPAMNGQQAIVAEVACFCCT